MPIRKTYETPTGHERAGHGSELRREWTIGYHDTDTEDRWEEHEWRPCATLQTSAEERDQHNLPPYPNTGETQ